MIHWYREKDSVAPCYNFADFRNKKMYMGTSAQEEVFEVCLRSYLIPSSSDGVAWNKRWIDEYEFALPAHMLVGENN